MSLYSYKLAYTNDGVVQLSDEFKDLLESGEYHFNCTSIEDRERAYKKCDVLRSAIGVGASFIANLRVWALDPDTGEQVKSPLAVKEIDKLMNPNVGEDMKIFFKKLDSQVKLHGRGYVRKLKFGGDEFYYVIENRFVTEVYGTDSDVYGERKVIEYIINDGAKSYTLKPDEVHIFYDVVLNTMDYTTFFGGNRAESLSNVISTYVTIWEVLNEMYGNHGALNIIGMGVKDAQMMSLNQTRQEKESLYTKLRSFGLRKSQEKNLVSSLDAKVSKLSADMREMMFPEILKECKKAIYNGFNLPAELFGIESSRFKTVPEARKEAYTQNAIPTFEYYISEWMSMRGVKDKSFIISPDCSHLDFYQEAKLQESIAFQQIAGSIIPLVESGLMTKDEARIKLDLQ